MVTRLVLFSLMVLVPASVLVRGAAPPAGERPRYKSPLGLSVAPDGKIAYVALHTADALAVVDLKANRVLDEIPVGKRPYDVALLKGIAYVTCEADDTVVAVDVAARTVKRTYKVGQAPRGIAVDRHTGLLHVVCHDDKALWMLTPTTGKFKKVPIPPQPEGNFARASTLELTLGSNAAYKPAARPHGLFTHGETGFSPRPAPIDPQRTAFNPSLDLDTSRSGMDLAAHTRPRWFTPTRQAPQDRVFTNAFSFFLNSTGGAAVVLLDEPDKGYPDPTDVVVRLPRETTLKTLPLARTSTADTHPLKGARVFISSGGADTVVVLDLHKAAKHAQANPPTQQFGGLGGWNGSRFNGPTGGGNSGFGFGGPLGGFPAAQPNRPAGFNTGRPGWGGYTGGNLGGNIGFQTGGGQLGGFGGSAGWTGNLSGFREDLSASASYTLARLPTQANPRRMVLTPDGTTLVVSNYLADSLTQIDAESLRVRGHISLGGPGANASRRGEVLFHSAKFTFQQQFTCASCHPNGSSDGLAWDTSPSATGEPLNTRALHGVRDTGPFGWRGDSATFADRVRNTMREVHRHKISDANAADLAAYLETLPPPRPLPQQARDRPAIDRGKALFFGKARCARCHDGPAFTSEYRRAVVTNHKNELAPFDVPSLRGVGRTAPYLHDGRALTLEEIFARHNPHKRHGAAHLLGPAELRDLVAFLKSL